MRVPLIHGFAGNPSAWDATIAAWCGPGEPFAIALPGHGGGPVQGSWDGNLGALDLGDAEVAVGYSLGARVALGLVASGRLQRAVLIGVNPGIPDDERAARRAADAAWARLLRERGVVAFADAWAALPLFASQRTVAPALLAVRRAHRLALDPDELARCLEVMGLAEMPDLHGAVDDRCALLVGELDDKFVAIAGELPAPLEVIPGAGHDPTLEQPVALAAAIARALERLLR